MEWFMYIGMGLIFVTGLLSGGWTTGQQQRANFQSSTDEERLEKDRWSTWTFIGGVVCLLIAGVLYYT